MRADTLVVYDSRTLEQFETIQNCNSLEALFDNSN